MDPAHLLSLTALSMAASFLTMSGKALRLYWGFCQEPYVYLISHSQSPGGLAIWTEKDTAGKWHTQAENKEDLKVWPDVAWFGVEVGGQC